MRVLKNRANLLMKWRMSEGHRARATWIGSPLSSRHEIERERAINVLHGPNRRMI